MIWEYIELFIQAKCIVKCSADWKKPNRSQSKTTEYLMKLSKSCNLKIRLDLLKTCLQKAFCDIDQRTLSRPSSH